ncbi:MAG: hypothetical protein M3Z15_13200 [Pseudomonadota bacterium]|nr:hypothetical protein [Pseudomonadota bacterium]
MALFALDRLNIDREELVAQFYGGSTARAVLAFKTKRQIINRAYQSKPDNIVGKMTIARLDREMFFFEATNRPSGECDIAPRGAAPALRSGLTSSPALGLAASKALVGDGPAGRKPQLNRALRIYCSITKRAALETGFPLAAHIEKAKELLAGFGMTLSLEFTPLRGTGFGDTINFPFGQVGPEEIPLLRKASEDTRKGSPTILRVIVCPRSPNEGPGETFRNVSVGGVLFPPFVVLNSTTASRDSATLLHEMIHAALDRPVAHDGDRFSVFFEFSPTRLESADRVVLPTDRAIALSKAFFAI